MRQGCYDHRRSSVPSGKGPFLYYGILWSCKYKLLMSWRAASPPSGEILRIQDIPQASLAYPPKDLTPATLLKLAHFCPPPNPHPPPWKSHLVTQSLTQHRVWHFNTTQLPKKKKTLCICLLVLFYLHFKSDISNPIFIDYFFFVFKYIIQIYITQKLEILFTKTI